MSSSSLVENIVATQGGVSVGASAVDTDVSKKFISGDSRYANVTVVLSAVTDANASTTFSLKDSVDGDYFEAVGDQSVVTVVRKQFNGATAVDPSTDQITLTSHGLVTGQAVLLSGEGSTLPTGLAAATTYYIIVVDANTVQLAASQADALAGTEIDITADGTNANMGVYVARYNIRMIIEDATDAAQLPLQRRVKVVANTGAGDSVTVSAVYADYSPQSR